MVAIRASIIFGVALLAGCANPGVQPGSTEFPSDRFEVPVDYLSAYRRAGEYFRTCYIQREHPYRVGYTTRADVDLKGTVGTIELVRVDQPVKVLVRYEAEPKGPTASTSTVTVLGDAPWDQREIGAVKASVLSATPQCQSD